MNAAQRTVLQTLFVKAFEQAMQEADDAVYFPVMGDSTLHHMANAAVNVLEAIEDAEDYIGDQLPDETRMELGI